MAENDDITAELIAALSRAEAEVQVLWKLLHAARAEAARLTVERQESRAKTRYSCACSPYCTEEVWE